MILSVPVHLWNVLNILDIVIIVKYFDSHGDFAIFRRHLLISGIFKRTFYLSDTMIKSREASHFLLQFII